MARRDVTRGGRVRVAVLGLLAGCAWVDLDAVLARRDRDGDGYAALGYGGLDCDDDPSDDLEGAAAATDTHPGAVETWYDGVDEDCAGDSDYDADADGDDAALFGGPDCDDEDPSVSSAAAETCDGRDNDCDGRTDDEDEDLVGGRIYYEDLDGDRYGNAAFPITACELPPLATDLLGDCDDTEEGIHPLATEVFYDGVDQNCDGRSDFDQDEDTFTASGAPEGTGDDCDDDPTDDPPEWSAALANPSADETWYDGLDQDCDGGNDFDQDGDGHDAPADCDDDPTDDIGTVFAPEIHPGAEETWYDGIDQDCDGASDYDADGDGRDSGDHGGKDCDDSREDVRPGALEVCDGVDNDCDGLADDDDDASNPSTWYLDDDEDGFGTPTAAKQKCAKPARYVDNDLDCDDTESATNPAADEICIDTVDSDCDAMESCTNEHGPTPLVHPDDHALEVRPAGDLDQDGTLDLAVNAYGNGQAYLVFGPIGRADALDLPGAVLDYTAVADLDLPVALGDVSGDGFPDVGVRILQTFSTKLLLGPEGTGLAEVDGVVLESLTGGDLDGDGQGDIAGRDALTLAVYLFRGPFGSSTPAEDSVAMIAPDVGAHVPTAVAAGDFEGSGSTQIAVGMEVGFRTLAGDEDEVRFFPGEATGALDPIDGDPTLDDSKADTAFGGRLLLLPDPDGSGHDDLLVGAAPSWGTDGRAYVFEGPMSNRDTTEADATLFSSAGVPRLGVDLSAGDADGDGFLDVLLLSQDDFGIDRAYLVPGPIAGVIDVEESAVAIVRSADATSSLLYSVAFLGDLDGDGFEEMGIGGRPAFLAWGNPDL